MKKKKIFIVIEVLFIMLVIAYAIFKIFLLLSTTEYYTPILISDEEYGVTFDDSYKVSLTNKKCGTAYIEFDNNIHKYIISAKFKKRGYTTYITELILEDSNGNKRTFNIDVWLGMQNPDGGQDNNTVQVRENITNKVLKGWKTIYSEYRGASSCVTLLAELE